MFRDFGCRSCIDCSWDGLDDYIWYSWIFVRISKPKINLMLTIDDILDSEIRFMGFEIFDGGREVALVFQED